MSTTKNKIQQTQGTNGWMRFVGRGLLALIVSALLYSCTNEEGGGIVPAPQQIEDSDMALSLRLNGSRPSTRLGEADENKVSEVDVLVFDHTTGKYLYAAAAYRIDAPQITASEYKYPFAVRLRMLESETERVDLWVVANAHALLNKMTLGSTPADSTKATVAAKLLANETDDKVTQLPVTDPITLIPMWGKIDNVSIPLSGATPPEVELTRMVAKIDVAVAMSVPTTTFTLTSVSFYNRNTSGRVVPGAITNSGATWSAPTAIPTYSLPASPGKATGVAHEYNTVTSNAIVNTIYAFEAEGGDGYTSTDGIPYDQDPCLVIGGKFNGSTQDTYYRVNFVEIDDNTETYLDILRNHHYEVKIESVTGAGFATKEEALKSLPVNMVAVVTPWDEIGMGDITFDGQYMLSVDRDSVTIYQATLYGDPGEQTIQVYTDWEEGWAVDTCATEPAFPKWLKITSPAPAVNDSIKGGKDNIIPLVMNAAKLPEAVSSRNGSFYITAGRMRKLIKVAQVDVREVKLTIEPATISFKKNPMLYKAVKITTVPANLPVTITAGTRTGGAAIIWRPGYDPMGYNGKKFPAEAIEMELRPDKKLDGVTTYMYYTFTVTSEGMVATQTLNITQQGSDYIFNLTPLEYEAIDQGDKISRVLAETDWRLLLEPYNNPDNKLPYGTGKMLTLLPDATPANLYPATTDGVYRDYRFFTLAQNHDYVDRIAKFTIEENNPDWQPDPIEITQKGTDPDLTLISPAEATPTLTLTNPKTEVAFTTNANWRFTKGTGYADVVAATEYKGTPTTTITTGTYTNTANSDALVSPNYVIELTKQTALAHEKAYTTGATYETTLKLETTNHGTATSEEKTVTVTRDVVPMWTIPTFSPSGASPIALPIGGADVTVTAHTNQGWTAGWNLGDGAGDHTEARTATYLNNPDDKKTVSVPSNSENFTPRTVTLWAYKTEGGVKGGDSLKTYTQPKATLDVIDLSGTGAAIPAAGVDPSPSVSATFDGTHYGYCV
jgi:hypothetical protein